MSRPSAKSAAPPTPAAVERLTGGVVRIFPLKGFAFLNSGETDYFLHASELLDTEIAALKIGDEIQFTPTDGEKGPRAHQAQRVFQR